MKKTILKVSGILSFVATITFGQINMPLASPFSTVTQKIGIVDSKVEYSRPSVKGRKIFGDVVTMDKIWRAGANSTTKIMFSDSVTIGGKKIAGGTYALYAVPSATSWTIVLGKNIYAYATDHKEVDDVVRFTVPVVSLATQVETFTIDYANLTKTSADVMLSWESTAVKFTVSTNPDSKIMEEIKSKTDNTDNFWMAASYYYDNDKDLKKALEWCSIVTEKNPQFWTYNLKGKILIKMKDCNAAVEALKKSSELALIAKNDDYVKMNTKLMEGCPVSAPSKKK